MHTSATTLGPPTTENWEEVTKIREHPLHFARHKRRHGPHFCCKVVCVCVCVCVCVRARAHAKNTPFGLQFNFTHSFWSCFNGTLQHNGSGFYWGKRAFLSFQNTANAKSRREKSKEVKINAHFLLDQEECYLKRGTNGFSYQDYWPHAQPFNSHWAHC